MPVRVRWPGADLEAIGRNVPSRPRGTTHHAPPPGHAVIGRGRRPFSRACPWPARPGPARALRGPLADARPARGSRGIRGRCRAAVSAMLWADAGPSPDGSVRRPRTRLGPGGATLTRSFPRAGPPRHIAAEGRRQPSDEAYVRRGKGVDGPRCSGRGRVMTGNEARAGAAGGTARTSSSRVPDGREGERTEGGPGVSVPFGAAPE